LRRPTVSNGAFATQLFSNSQFLMADALRGSRCVTVPNFVKIGQEVFEISRFVYFSRWRTPTSWITEILKFYYLRGSGGPRRITLPNFIKICQSVAKIAIFFLFLKMAADGRPPSWICFSHIWTTHKGYLAVLITVQNLAAIDAVLSKI